MLPLHYGPINLFEMAVRLELTWSVLQTDALPLGHTISNRSKIKFLKNNKKSTGISRSAFEGLPNLY